MNLGIWLVPVLLGFAILNFTHIHRRAFIATTGYQFFFLAALAGAVLFVAAHFVVLVADALGNVLHPQSWTGAKALWKYVAPFAHSGKLAAAALLGLGYIFGANMMVRDRDAAARWVKRTEGAAESLLSPVLGRSHSCGSRNEDRALLRWIGGEWRHPRRELVW